MEAPFFLPASLLLRPIIWRTFAETQRDVMNKGVTAAMAQERSEREDEMLQLAAAAREEAYAPYSGYRVGACIESEEGLLFAGCNVENASYPEGSCAETGALAAMVAAGQRRVRHLVLTADGERLCTPCGGCRQLLSEFAGPDTPVIIYGDDGLRARLTLGELLPHAFDLPNDAAG